MKNTKNKVSRVFRHGDIPVIAFNGELKGKEIKHNGSFVLAEGETTGHKHLLTCARMEIRQNEHGYYLALQEEGTLTHEEHKTIVLPKGKYYVGKEREMDHFAGAVKRVVD